MARASYGRERRLPASCDPSAWVPLYQMYIYFTSLHEAADSHFASST
jgi:hypothetical protein